MHLHHLFAFLSLIFTISALPAPSLPLSSITAPSQHSPACLSYSYCLSQGQDEDFCREVVCGEYSDECTVCDFNTDTDITAGAATDEVAVQPRTESRKPPPSNCIVICTHAHCMLMCAGAADTSTDISTASINPSTSTSLALPLLPEKTTIILSRDEKAVNGTCAWMCSYAAMGCWEKCWSSTSTTVLTPTSPSTSTTATASAPSTEQAVQCQIAESPSAGKKVVCYVSATEDVMGGLGGSAKQGGGGEEWCELFWRGEVPMFGCSREE